MTYGRFIGFMWGSTFGGSVTAFFLTGDLICVGFASVSLACMVVLSQPERDSKTWTK